MCGITGIIEDSTARHEAALSAMIAALAHRGPDDEGSAIFDLPTHASRVRLGHRRLTILDLSPAGHQPMRSAASGACLILNGEIYNFRDLRAELKAVGQTFASTGDTEVVLKGYDVWGLEVLSRLRGMFALALFDPRDATLLLARDRAGIKPLYYARRPHTDVPLIFASEVRALLASGLLPRRLNREAVAHYLANGFVPDPLTIVAGVQSLLPAHYVRFDASGRCIECCSYWQPQAAGGDGRACTRAEAVRRVREALEATVEQHLVSDVPLGAFLSGGVDSSAIVALMARRAPGQTRTFSLVFDDPQLSEEVYSRAVARRLGTEHRECRIRDPEFLSLLDDGLAALDQPSTDGLNSYVVSRKCRESGLVVALAGTGGDELFGGYSSFTRVPRALRMLSGFHRLPKRARESIVRAAERLLLGGKGYAPSSGLKGKLTWLLGLPPDSMRVYHLSRLVHLPPVVGHLTGNAQGLKLCALPARLIATIARRAGPHDEIRAKVSVYEQMLYLSNQLLRDTDAVSMAVSLEVRVPFLDHVLLDTVEALPPRFRFDARFKKRLLIDAVRDVLPREAYQRRKQGFVLPLGRWLAGPLRRRVHGLLDDPSATAAAGLDHRATREVVTDCLAAGDRVYFTRLWGLFVLVDWCRRNGVTSDAAPHDEQPVLSAMANAVT